MKWQTLKPYAYNLSMHEVIKGNYVDLIWTRSVSSILTRGAGPKYGFEGPENYKHLIKIGAKMLEAMNQKGMQAEKLEVNLIEVSGDEYLLGDGVTPFITGAKIYAPKGCGKVDSVGRSLICTEMGLVEMLPVTLPACFHDALEHDDFDKCQSILDIMSSIPSLFGRFEYKPDYQLRPTTEGEDISWDITTSQEEPLLIITT